MWVRALAESGRRVRDVAGRRRDPEIESERNNPHHPPETERDGYFPFAPDLAVEVLSPGDRTGATTDKVLDYLEAGRRLVWVVEPRRRIVTVYHPDGASHVLREGRDLEGGDVLPEFPVALADLFR